MTTETIEVRADETCSRCYGSGTIEVPDEAGPNAHPMDINCPACRGVGAQEPPRGQRSITDPDGYLSEPSTETIEVRLDGELYTRVAAIANLADVPIESIIRVALAYAVLDEPKVEAKS